MVVVKKQVQRAHFIRSRGMFLLGRLRLGPVSNRNWFILNN